MACAEGSRQLILCLVRRMRSRRVSIAAGVVVVLAAAFIVFRIQADPLRRSDSEIRASILGKTPIGSTREHVLATIEREGWLGHREYRGIHRPEVEHHSFFGYGAEISSYAPFFIFPCYSSAYWLFGADDRVSELFVSRWCEGL